MFSYLTYTKTAIYFFRREKLLLFWAFLFHSFIGFSQFPGCPDVNAGVDQVLPCSQNCTNLTATPFQTGAPTSYAVSSITHSPPIAYNAAGGTAVSVNIDDVWSPPITLPFSFCYYGTNYTTINVGSNGAIQFGGGITGGSYHPWPYTANCPNSALTAAGDVFGVYHDIDPSVAGSVKWYITGTAPCRIFVVSYNNLGHYSCTSLRSTHMMVLYETTNVIDVYVNNKATCTSWNGGAAIIGIQNPTGTAGITAPGRNTNPIWTITSPEAWRFTPNGPPNYTIAWFQGTNQIGTSATINVCPVGTTTYTAQVSYTMCNGTTVQETDQVNVSYGSAVPIINLTSVNETCTGVSNGSATASPSGGAPGYTYSWSTIPIQTTQTATGLSAGAYTCTVTDANGCVATQNVTITATTPTQPTGLSCWQTATLNTTSCSWLVSGTQAAAPSNLACYETTIFNTTTCVWDLTGTQPVQPTVACYETATFNTITCVWDVTGTQPVQPTLECYETATFNTITCVWDVTGMQPVQPTVACYETAMFNTITCVWDVTGTQPVQPTLSCYETTIFNATTCVWDLTGTQPVQPTVACYETATFNTITCVWDVTGTQPVQPILSCYETTIFNITTCVWDVTGTQPVQPTVACYETATFNTITCVWDVTGTQPVQPTVACYETATFNSTSCSWDVTGTEIINTTFISVCDDYTWANNGQTYTASGVYFGITTNCVSELLDLTITPSFTNTLSQTACDSYAWNGTTYTSSGVYIGTTANCVTESLDLTIIPNILPSFPQVGPYCSGATIPPLTTTSTNGISGSWLPAINNTAITTYTFTPTVGECAIIQTMSIFIAPILSSTNFVVICISDLPFLWNGNQYNETGIFTYNTSTAAGCDSVAILDITINPNPIASFTPSLNSFTETPQSIYFTNSSIGAISYSWDFGDGSYSTEVNPDHLYTDNLNGHTITLISESSEGCLGSSQITIEFIEGLIYYIPNSFTPDGDGYNQTFKPVFTSGFDPYNYEMLIFNRWGEIIFETHDVTYGWDGKYALKNCREGIYSYKITFKNPILDERKVVCGSIILLK